MEWGGVGGGGGGGGEGRGKIFLQPRNAYMT